MNPSLEQLIADCKRRQGAAQRSLYDRFAPQLLAVCYRYARDRSEAEDFLQEAFIKIFQKLDRYDFQGSFEGWMRRIVVNTSIDLLRRRKHQMRETDIEAAYGAEVSDDAINNLELEYLYGIIHDLPTGYRMVFNLYAIEGFSHREIGEKLGINESTSRSQYTRARALLMQRIREDHLESNIYRNAI